MISPHSPGVAVPLPGAGSGLAETLARGSSCNPRGSGAGVGVGSAGVLSGQQEAGLLTQGLSGFGGDAGSSLSLQVLSEAQKVNECGPTQGRCSLHPGPETPGPKLVILIVLQPRPLPSAIIISGRGSFWQRTTEGVGVDC